MVTTSLMTPDASRWSMLRLEYAEYNHGTPLSIDLDLGCICDCEMDDFQPLMCFEYCMGEHEDSDWDSIDDDAMHAESDYWFSNGLMTIR